jgi:hypothetical protein
MEPNIMLNTYQELININYKYSCLLLRNNSILIPDIICEMFQTTRHL